jgi:Uma2 family endonuclease
MSAILEKPAPQAAERGLLTSEEFLDWLEPGLHADLIDGEIVMHSPVNLDHATLLNFMDRLLGGYIEEADLGVLHRETVAVRLSVRETFLPDLAFFTKSQVARLPKTHAPFAPTFVLEALSPSTASNDTGRKFAAYELHQVQEYWIIDPHNLTHRFYRRSGDMFEEFGTQEDLIRSVSIPGFWIKRSWLDPNHLPKVTACLKEILASRPN